MSQRINFCCALTGKVLEFARWQYIPRIGEEVRVKETWFHVTRVSHDMMPQRYEPTPMVCVYLVAIK